MKLIYILSNKKKYVVMHIYQTTLGKLKTLWNALEFKKIVSKLDPFEPFVFHSICERSRFSSLLQDDVLFGFDIHSLSRRNKRSSARKKTHLRYLFTRAKKYKHIFFLRHNNSSNNKNDDDTIKCKTVQKSNMYQGCLEVTF